MPAYAEMLSYGGHIAAVLHASCKPLQLLKAVNAKHRVEPIDFVKENKLALEFIAALSLNKPIMQPLPVHGGYGGGGGDAYTNPRQPALPGPGVCSSSYPPFVL